MIKVENIAKTFGAFTAVDHVSFTVQGGENLVFLGRSGCGKTTLLKMINRLIEPSSGEIYIDGDNIYNRPPEDLRRKIGYVFQNTGLFPHYTIAGNIAIVPRLLGWDKEKINKRIKTLMDKLHLPTEYLSSYPNQLSG